MIKYLSGQQRTFTVEPTDTIGSLVEAARAHDIVAELSDEPKPFKLACWALRVRELDVNQTFEACGIQVGRRRLSPNRLAPLRAQRRASLLFAGVRDALAAEPRRADLGGRAQGVPGGRGEAVPSARRPDVQGAAAARREPRVQRE